MSLPVHLASEQFLLKTQKYTNISQHLFTAKKEKEKKDILNIIKMTQIC